MILTAAAIVLLTLLAVLRTTYGRTILETAGRSIQVTADGRPEMKHAGVTIDWTTVTAAGSDTTWNDGVLLRSGKKGLRYGQVICQITATGLYGPYDPAAADGRQLIGATQIGLAYILNESILMDDDIASDHPPVLEGGLVFLGRIIQVGTGTASLAAGPTLANLKLTFPRLRLVTE